MKLMKKGKSYLWIAFFASLLFGISLCGGSWRVYAGEVTMAETRQPDNVDLGTEQPDDTNTGTDPGTGKPDGTDPGTEQPDDTNSGTDTGKPDGTDPGTDTGKPDVTEPGTDTKQPDTSAGTSQGREDWLASEDTKGRLTCTYKGKKIKNAYLAIYKKGSRYEIAAKPDGGSRIYFFDKEGYGTKYIGTGVVKLRWKSGTARYYVKKARTVTAKKTYYIVCKKHCYKIGKSGKAAVYVKNSRKKGTYCMEIDGVCFQVGYRDGAVKKYTGWHQKRYYEKGKRYTGWKTAASKRQYLKKGAVQTGWVTVGKKKYCFDKKGVLLKNQIVGGKYVDKDGVYVSDKTVRLAVKFVEQHSSSSHSRSARLKECYDYLWRNIPYKRTYGIPGRSDMDDIAYSMLYHKCGNCFCFASTFAYIARVLGFDSRIVVGEISSIGGGMTPHGWTEVYVNGGWRICDPDMQMNYPRINVYMQREADYPYRHHANRRYRLTAAAGKAVWKSVIN